MKINDVELNWLGHAGFQIKNLKAGKIFYVDPYNVSSGCEKADVILITHSHYDHCSFSDMQKIVKPDTKVFLTADCQSKILRFDFPIKMEIVEVGQDFSYGEAKISILPAYNLDKPFHSKSEEWVGYLLKFGDVLIYHAGDTDNIPEMQKLTGHGDKKLIALLPIGGRFTMDVEEAVEAAKLIKPFLAVPMHYGSIVGSLDDAKEFVEMCKEENINAEILEKS
jgi:L-ascorbate metabolism protein UlaG (beta-lactamase superfamily)